MSATASASANKLPIYKSFEVFVYEKAEFIDPKSSYYVGELDDLVDTIAERLNTTFHTAESIEYFHRKGVNGTGFGIFDGVATHYFEIKNEIQVQISNDFYRYTDNNVEMTKWSVLFQFIYFNYDAYHTATPIVDCFLSEADRSIHELHNKLLSDYIEDMREAHDDDYSNNITESNV